MRGKVVGWIREFLDGARDLSRYDVGETVEGLAQKLGLEPSAILKLNSNENLFIPIHFLRETLMEVVRELDPRIYPRDERSRLEEELSRYLGVKPDQIVIGAGSDQLIELVVNAFLNEKSEAISIFPTFPIYERVVRIRRAGFRRIPLKGDFSLDVDQMLSEVKPETKLIFLCSPNNPTANQFPLEDVGRLIEGFDGVVVVDEAYAEFAEYSLINLADRFENLIVLRTFSKSFGLAGLRLGYLISDGEIATILRERFQMPYAASSIAIRMGLKLLERVDVIEDAIMRLREVRKRFLSRLNHIDGVRAFNSETNFILMSLNKNSDMVYSSLLSRGVIVRKIGDVLGYRNCIRVTVAPQEMMDQFIEVLEEVLADNG